jgi:hypothetical protein
MAEVKGHAPESSQVKFLKALSDLLLEGKIRLTDDYFRLIWFFLFFAPGRTHNVTLLALAGFSEIRPTLSSAQIGFVEELQEIVDMQPSLLGNGPPDDVIEGTLINSRLVDYEMAMFGLRFDREGNWLDIELARDALKLYQMSQREQFASCIAVLAAFMAIAGESDFIASVLPTLSKPIGLSFSKSRERGISPEFLQQLEKFALTPPPKFLNLGNDRFRSYHHRLKNIIQVVPTFFSQPIDKVIESIKSQLNKTNERIEFLQLKADREWKLLWTHLTSENAPWRFEQTTVRYRRDFTPTVAFCPFRTKINRHFDMHTEASQLRDSGKPASSGSKEELPPVFIDDEDSKSVMSTVVFEQNCQKIKVVGSKPTTFALTNAAVLIGGKSFPLSDIKYVFWRRFRFISTGIEIFFISNKSFLLDFAPHYTSKDIVKLIRKRKLDRGAIVQTVPFAEFVGELDLPRRWSIGELSNFEYLVWLNLLAGRSFHDPSQYPIMPWVLTDSEAEQLDLRNSEAFRDLTKPVGALGKERLQELLIRVHDLIQFNVTPFLYSAYCSFPLSVFLFLIRMEPFTTMHIDLQGGRFDTAQRVFASIPVALNSVLSQLNDYRELVPEFFYEPEFLVNSNGFDLGLGEQGPIDTVELPRWSKTPMEFVYLNRKALESSVVSSRLNGWIDLIFGCSQRGEAAVKAYNYYKEEMYDDIWDHEDDPSPQRRREIESTIDQVGQVPPQLFVSPHVSHRPDIPVTSRLKNIVTFQLPFTCVFAAFSDEKDEIVILGTDSQCGRVALPQIFDQDLRQIACEELPTKSLPKDLDNFVKLSDETFAALCNHGLESVLLGIGGSFEVTRIAMNRQRITAISSAHLLLSLSSADSRTHIFQLANGRLAEKFSIPTYRNSVVCSCLSRQFGIVVNGTDDRALVIGSLTDSSTIRLVHLDHVPRKVIVTPHWGFVVVHARDYVDGKEQSTLSVFNINGVTIKTITLKGVVEHWATWSSPRGFDFMVLSTEHGKLYAFEVFFLDLEQPVYRCYCDLVSLDYSKKSNMIVAVATDRTIHLVPFLARTVEKYAD